MKKIPLTQGKFALVDDEDFEYLNQWKWFFHTDGYATRWKKFVETSSSKKRQQLFMHQAVLGGIKGIDHIDCNRLNNQKSNLRPATKLQNSANKRKHKNNTSGYKGVYFDKRGIKHFFAKIVIKDFVKYLGYFNTPEEAHEAYKEAAKKYHGEFARW